MMSTSTVEDHDTVADLDGPADTAKKPSRTAKPQQAVRRARRTYNRLSEAADEKSARTSGRTGFYAKVAAYRLLVLLIDYVVAMVLATTVIPMLGAWLHQQSPAAQNTLTLDGTIAVWVVPFAFMVVLLTVAVLVLMRGLWRWSSRRIDRARALRFPEQARTATISRAAVQTKAKSKVKPGSNRPAAKTRSGSK